MDLVKSIKPCSIEGLQVPRLTDSMIEKVDWLCSKWRPAGVTKPKTKQIVDWRFSVGDDGAATRQKDEHYFQFEDDTMYVTTARFVGEELLEVYRHPEYEPYGLVDAIKSLDVPISFAHWYQSFDAERNPGDVYLPVQTKSLQWLLVKFPWLKDVGTEEDDYIVRLGPSMTEVNRVYVCKNIEGEKENYKIYYFMPSGPAQCVAFLSGVMYDLESLRK